jgi:hypothetical protein
LEYKSGQRIHLKFSPEQRGTITGIRGREFRVTWDGRGYDEKGRRKPRTRLWYPADALKHGMEIGNP